MGKLIVGLAVGLVAALLYAFTLYTYWGWFVLPLGAPPIGYAHAYGLSLLVRAATFRAELSVKDDDHDGWTTIVIVVVTSTILNGTWLLTGLITHALMTG